MRNPDRRSMAHNALVDDLVRETGRLLGKDAAHLRERITLHRAAGRRPNWGADIAAVSAYELSAFRQALESMLALYELD
jgi:Ser/Thr protein kinase RdoA (MazF antagonist)